VTASPKDDESRGGTIVALSIGGSLAAAGNAFQAGRSLEENKGGAIVLHAMSDVTLDGAVVSATGDTRARRRDGRGGVIDVRSFQGSVSWADGVGDVRPTGTASRVPISKQGEIAVVACQAVNVPGTSFPTNGPPSGPFPSMPPADCTVPAPSLPPGEPPLRECGSVADAAPAVTSTFPENGGTAAADTDVTISFSEPVNVADGAFRLECPAGTSIAFDVSPALPGGVASYTLQPATNLQIGTSCTVTIAADGVSDVDAEDPPDTMEAGHVFTFTTAGVAPSATDDTASVLGNVSIVLDAIANDFAGDPAALVSAVGSTAVADSSASLNADGTITYNPPPGYEGADSFTYTIANPSGSSTATVNLTIAGMIWFIDGAAPAGGDGRLSNPFNSLASFVSINDGAGNHPAAGDHIFVYQNAAAYDGGIALLGSQTLSGQDAGASLEEITGLTPPAGSAPLPLMNAGDTIRTVLGGTVTPATGSGVRGLSISTTGVVGFTASNVTGVTVREVHVATANRTAVNLANTDGRFAFTSVSSNNPLAGSSGIALLNTTGSFSVTGTGSPGSGGAITGVSGGSGVQLITSQDMALALSHLAIDGTGPLSGNGLVISFGTSSAMPALTTLVDGVTIRNLLNGIRLTTPALATPPFTIDLTVRNSTLGTTSQPLGSALVDGRGIDVDAYGTTRVLIENNTANVLGPTSAARGFSIVSNGAADATVRNNAATAPATATDFLLRGTAAGTQFCLDLTGNGVAADAGSDYLLDSLGAGFVVRGPGTAPVTAADIEAAQQPGGQAALAGSILFNNNTACALPEVP
jgi:hypothetical protein